MKYKDERYEGFTVKFKKVGNRIYATFKSSPKHIGSVDKHRPIGIGNTKTEAFKKAKDTIEMELESFYEPRFY